MKKIMYSNITKTVAFILCLCMIGFAVIKFVSVMYDVKNDYSFESNYTDSYKISEPITNTEEILRSYLRGELTDTQTYMALEKYDDTVKYFVSSEDKTIITNIPEVYSEGYTFPAEEYSYLCEKNNGSTTVTHGYDVYTYSNEDEYNPFGDYENENNPQGNYTIYITLSDDYASAVKEQWNRGRSKFEEMLLYTVSSLTVALLLFIYLVAVAGKNGKDKEIHTFVIDRMYVEFNLFFAGCAIVAGIAILLCTISWIFDSGTYNFSILFGGTVLFLAVCAILMELTLSMVRNLKNRTFLSRCLCCKAFKYLCTVVKKYFSAMLSVACKKISWLIAGAILLYTFILTILAASHELGLLLVFILIAAVFTIKKLDSANNIINGIFELKNGNTDYRIEDCSDKLFRPISEAINTIGDGINKAVEEKTKSERMKSELITNVSHDLKTPLTSIINYTDLLSQMNLTPDEANDYVKIIGQKAERLKCLTNDLFDISKVQSGSEKINLERIDIALLAKQTIGELDETIKKSGLEFELDFPESEVFIMADGKKISRVMENLIINASKYSMKGTRVYAVLKTYDDNIVIEIKNIASYKMNFDGNDITERFVRGDKSRSTDGSGLGLAIAKSYTEACGGIFKITVDGDLFKATLTFEKL